MVKRWFRQSRYTSFQRQLNMYRFTRIANGPDKNGYHHPYFLRGREDLTRHILRLPRDATGLPRTDRVMAEPNFYTMSPVTKNTVVRLPNSGTISSVSSSNNEGDIQTALALPSLPPRNQHPLQSTTTNQANPAFLDNFVSSRTNPVLPNNSIVSLDLASRYLPPMLSTTDPFQSSRINDMAPNTTHNYSNLQSTYMPPGGAAAINPTASTDSFILERLLLSSAMNPYPDAAAAAAVLNPMIQPHHPLVPNIAPDPPMYDWTAVANLMLSQPRMPTEYNPLLVLPPQQQQPALDLTNIDRVTLARWIAHQQEQELALALLQQRRQP
jgi:HSF-type DNA-binding